MRKKSKSPGTQKRKSPPVYQQLADIIRQRIQSGEFAEGDRLPSTKQFSEEFKVNHLTTRQALKLLEQEALISMHAGRGTFVRSTKGKTAQIAVIVPSLGQQMPGEISKGMRITMTNGEDVSLTFIDYHEDPDFETERVQSLREDGFTGAIYFPSLAPQTIRPVLELITTGFPVVFLDRAIDGVPCWLVTSDNFAMGALAAKHLLEAGVKRPAALIMTFSNTLERLHGFRVELNNHGVPLPQERVIITPVGGDPEGDMTRKILALDERPDGIFYYNDYQALVGLKAIQLQGLKVPDEVKIIGCDDIEAAHLAIPALTSIHQSFSQVGAKALEMLMEMIRLPEHERFSSRHERIGVSLVARESTGA